MYLYQAELFPETRQRKSKQVERASTVTSASIDKAIIEGYY
jgi:hypothetical protein